MDGYIGCEGKGYLVDFNEAGEPIFNLKQRAIAFCLKDAESICFELNQLFNHQFYIDSICDVEAFKSF